MSGALEPLRVASAFPDPPFEVPGHPAGGRSTEPGAHWLGDRDPTATGMVTTATGLTEVRP